MKLRNKKTGEVWEFDMISMRISRTTLEKLGASMFGTGSCYAHSIAELTEEWDDYKSAEPLIKDEKVRRAVRAWSSANEIVKAFVVMNEHMKWTVYGDDVDRNRFNIEFFDRVVPENDETKNYTIAELCGDDKE